MLRDRIEQDLSGRWNCRVGGSGKENLKTWASGVGLATGLRVETGLGRDVRAKWRVWLLYSKWGV